MFETTVREGVLQARREDARWLSTGWDGGAWRGDAAIAACDPASEEAAFSGSATEVGACARACVRAAVRAGLESRYGEETDATVPESVADAEYGVVTDRCADVFAP